MAARFLSLIKTLAEPANVIEGMLLDIYMAFLLPTATGAQLQMVGGRVGQAQNGMSEADYRKAIRARIAVNRSTGNFRDIKRIVLAFAPTVRIESGGGVAFIDVGFLPESTILMIYDFLQRAIEATVRLQVFYLPYDPEVTFQFARAAIYLSPVTGEPTWANVQGANNLPDAGTIEIGIGTDDYEIATYTSRDDARLYGLTWVNSHPAGTAMQLVYDPNQGFGDSADATIGGHLAAVVGY